MDGDIYGPSMPTMLGIKGQSAAGQRQQDPPASTSTASTPITIGSLVEQDKPLIWRGPMAHGAFKQLLLDNTEWPELDYLIVDLPPGTGDVPLTLCQLLPLTGAVVVATPQQVALDDAIRAVRMFQQLGAPILGIVENMSYLPMPDGTARPLRPRRRRAGRAGTGPARSSARCRCTPNCASTATPATRRELRPATPSWQRRSRRSCRTWRGRSASGTSPRRGRS